MTGDNKMKECLLHYVSRFICQGLILIVYINPMYQNLVQWTFTSGHVINPSEKVFNILVGCLPPRDHCPSHVIIPWDSQLHFIIYHHLWAALVTPSHTSSLLAFFVSSQLCYRICFSCSLTHYFQNKYKLIKLCGCLVQFILLNQSSNYLVIHHPKK